MASEVVLCPGCGKSYKLHPTCIERPCSCGDIVRPTKK